MTATATIVFDAYAARSCPVKTHNAYDPTRRLIDQPDDALAELFNGGAQYAAVVVERLIAAGRGQVVDLRLLAGERRELQLEAAARARAVGAAVILGAYLPADLPGHRVGRPEILVRAPDWSPQRPAYHPAVVKWHRIIDRPRPVNGDPGPASPPQPPSSEGLPYSTLAEPTFSPERRLAAHRARTTSREADFLQLAHYHRLLDAAGCASSQPWGAVIGTDQVFDEPVLVWVDLSAPAVRTFSRSEATGWRLRSPLERYDHELAWRLAIAEVAVQQTGQPDADPAPLVQPIVNAECSRCPWWEECRPRLDPDDVSLRIDKAPLDLREIATLRRLGVATVTELAETDLDALLPDYLPEVTHRAGADSRLRLAARRARMLLAGQPFSRETEGPIDLPRAALEIDFDIESAADGRIYLWGFGVDDGSGAPRYVEFSQFGDLDDAREAALARDAFGWLRGQVERAPSVAVYHYSDYEVARIRALADRERDPLLDWAAAYGEEHFTDLLETVKAHYFGASGLGLKVIAGHTGFAWRDDDPGGLNSQRWFIDAVHAHDAESRARARRRVLEYNEDDVRATHHLRAWLRAQ